MLSIIICTYNRDKYIYNVLKSLAENTLSRKEYEIVLINNNSTDHTETECKRFTNRFSDIQFSYYVESEQGLSYARNRGIKEAKGDILIYVDDDALVNRDYLKTYADFFEQNPTIAAAGGPILPIYEEGKEPQWISHYTRRLITGKLYFGNKMKKFPRKEYPGGGNAAYRKEVFDEVGLFNVELGRKGNSLMGAEEKDIFDKMTHKNMCFFYLPQAILYHLIPKTKLTQNYFDRLTYAIGASERSRTLIISKKKFYMRLFFESIKWGASLLLALGYTLQLAPSKGWKLLQFRWNVSRGLLSIRTADYLCH